MNSEFVIPNPVVGRRYAFGGFTLFLTAVLVQGWTLLLLWPALAMLTVAGGYLWWGAGIYQKRNGKVGPVSAVLLAPTRFGQWLSLLYYRKKSTLYSEVMEGLHIGRQPSRQEAEELIQFGVNRVLDVTSEFSEPISLTQLTYLNLPIPDLTAPTREQLSEGVAFILEGLDSDETVYVHCKVGYSRSAAFIGAVLLSLDKNSSLEGICARLKEARPGIVIRPEIHKALLQYFQTHKCKVK